MCILSRPLQSREILQNFGGLDRNNLNNILKSDEVDTDIDLSSNSPYVSIGNIHEYSKDVKNNLSFFNLNSQSLPAKYDKIKVTTEYWQHEKSLSFTTLNFSETWLKASEENGKVDMSQFPLNGYQAFAAPAVCSKHGGVVTYVKDFLEVDEKQIFGSRFWDGIFLLVKGNGIKPFILCNVYRSPKNDNNSIQCFLDEFTPIIQSYCRIYKNIIVCGDFNLDLIKTSKSEKIANFLQFMLSNGLCPKITLPTRFAKYSASLLDHIFIKSEDDFVESKTKSGILHSTISDHCGCFSFLSLSKVKSTHFSTIEISANDEKSMNKFAQAIQESDLMSQLNRDVFSNPNETYAILESNLKRCITDHLPTKKVKFNKYKHKKTSWITFGLLKSIHTRDNMYRRWKAKPPTSQLYEALKLRFQKYKTEVDKLIRLAKIDFYQKEFDKFTGDIRKTWKTINTILNRNKRANNFPSHIISQNRKIDDKQEIVDVLNNYFCNIGQQLADNIPDSSKTYSYYLKKQITSTFSFSMVDTNTVNKMLKGFKPKTSKGFDGISMKMIKHVSDFVVGPITLLINQSLMTNIFPSKLKIAKIMPLLKKPNIFTPDNFRPISLLPCVSKIIEKCVFTQVFDYFENHKLLFGSQYGYRKNHSTETACLELVDKLYKQLDDNQSPFCVFIDLSKAFDTINHSILLAKLKYYGFDQNALSWFKSYLTDRKQFVEVDGYKSETKNIRTGVPQGSTLGPLLFIIYMNDINDVSDALSSILFADDTSLNSTISVFQSRDSKELSSKINYELVKVIDWLRANKLSLNVKKTKFMQFRYSQMRPHSLPKLSLKMDGVAIEKVETFIFLGLTISETLSWKHHVEKVRVKISKIIGVMNRIKYQVSSKILLTIYNSLVLSHLHYGILCWGFQCHGLFIVQKKAIRIICKSKYNAHTDMLFKKLKLLKIEDIFKIQCLKFYYRLCKNKIPHYFSTNFRFTRNIDVHERQLRHGNRFRLERVNRMTTRQTLRHYLPGLLNNTPETIMNSINTISILSYKKRIKKMYISAYLEECNKPQCYICNRE